MNILFFIAAMISSMSLLGWLYLTIGRGRFWKTDQYLQLSSIGKNGNVLWPSVNVVIPARNEADVIQRTLPTLLKQNYSGLFHVFLIDDCSGDNTGEIAQRVAHDTNTAHRLTVIPGRPPASGWTGKTWALEQGVETGRKRPCEFFLFTDADIAHTPKSLQSLIHKALAEDLDLVSLMVQLNVENIWEHLLIPAFVYYFAKLYPFRWVNDPVKQTAAAAGGCVLLSRTALERTGGLKQIAGALIDDCALAKQIKGQPNKQRGKIWLGLSRELHSLRHYNGLSGIWQMVSRTAYTQLNYSPFLLAVTILAMTLIYLVPPFGSVVGLVMLCQNGDITVGCWLTASSLISWVIMARTFLPILKWYRISSSFAFLLPLAGMLFTLMTIDSALIYRAGQGVAWKGRFYNQEIQQDPTDLI
ncbi:glycosyltransferase [Thermodesulfobacteriota bacterium]